MTEEESCDNELNAVASLKGGGVPGDTIREGGWYSNKNKYFCG